MSIVERVKSMLLSPKTEWPKIAAEPMTPQQIYTGWVMILAAIPPIAIAIGWGLTSGFANGIRFAIANYVILLVMTALIALVIDFLAPQFGGTRDIVAALKLSAYSYTAAFVAGVFHLLGYVGGFLVLIGMIYSWYTFYLGAPVLRKCAADRALLFTIVVVAIGFLVGMVLSVFASGGGFAPRTL